MAGFAMGPILGPISKFTWFLIRKSTISDSSSRPCGRRIPGSSKGLALGILDIEHGFRCLHSPFSHFHEGDLCGSNSPKKDQSSSKGDREYATTVQTRRGLIS